MILLVLLVFAAAALVVISFIAVLNALTFPRLRLPVTRHPSPVTISILIPARNEAAVIGQTVSRLLAQDYPDFEIIVLDDHSTDGTGEIVRSLFPQQTAESPSPSGGRVGVGGVPGLRVLSGEPLPAGWLGKNWACHQLAQAARGQWLVFTDADVRWEAGALSALVNMAVEHEADLLTVWPTQITVTAAERLVVPLLALVILGYLPAALVNHTPYASAAAANGQCLAFRRAAYDAIGGHAAVRGQIVEDIQLARAIKRAGRRLWMADGAGLIACRMYDGWPAVRDGFAKNILAGYGGRVPFLLLGWAFHWIVFLLPPAALVVALFADIPLRAPVFVLSAALTLLGVGVRALTAAATRQRVIDAVFMPVSVLLMSVIAARALVWHYTGGVRWKGRVIGNRGSQVEG